MPYWLIGGAILGGAALLGALLSDDEDESSKGSEGFEPNPSDEEKKRAHRKQLSDFIFEEYKGARKEQTKTFLKFQGIDNCKFKHANRNRSPDRLIKEVRDAVHEKLAEEKAAIERERAALEKIERLCSVLEDLSKPEHGERG